MLCCRRLTYARFIKECPETLFLWISLILPVGLIFYGITLKSSANLQYEMVRQNMTHMLLPYEKWCRENNSSCITHQYCMLVSHIFSLPSKFYRHQRSNCFGICSMPHCSNPIECWKQCNERWEQNEQLFDRAYSLDDKFVPFLTFGIILGFFWIILCIGSFSEYFYYVKHLKEQSILKQSV
jgi:hypothetical protein